MNTKYSIEWLQNEVHAGKNRSFLYFWGHTSPSSKEVNSACLSQWYSSPILINGITYPTTEHWMMAQKALLFNDYRAYQLIIDCETPKEAKTFGRQVLNFDQLRWEQYRYQVVRIGNIHKFNQHPELGEYLINTKGSVIVEASPADTIWGIGLTKDSEHINDVFSWRGLNLLGFALMGVRDFLGEHGFFDSKPSRLILPWVAFPKTNPQDMFWRMGKGEVLLDEFYSRYDEMPEQKKRLYQVINPAPPSWQDAYTE